MRLLAGRADVEDVDEFVAWVGAVGDETGCVVQAFDARYVASAGHLETAVERANRAFARGENVARDRGVEVLLYAAGRRQIDQAVEMGVSAGENVPVVVVVASDDGATGNDLPEEREEAALDALAGRVTEEPSVLGGGRSVERLQAFFEIPDSELSAAATDIDGLVRERVALLDVEK